MRTVLIKRLSNTLLIKNIGISSIKRANNFTNRACYFTSKSTGSQSYIADKQAEVARYTADKQAEAAHYTADKQAEAAHYTADKQARVNIIIGVLGIIGSIASIAASTFSNQSKLFREKTKNLDSKNDNLMNENKEIKKKTKALIGNAKCGIFGCFIPKKTLLELQDITMLSEQENAQSFDTASPMDATSQASMG